MNLTLSQIQSATLGALDIRQEEAGFRFSRMTPSQTMAFIRAAEEFGPKCGCPSGVRLDFHTDSDLLALRWSDAIQTAERAFCFFDVVVDGVLLLHSGMENCCSGAGDGFCVTLPAGEHRVQIFLPTLWDVTVGAVTLSDGATLVPHRPAKRILFHGDSITQGYDARFPSGCYANLLARHYDAEILNQAIGGALFDPAIVQPVGAFDFIVVAYGTNDWRHCTLGEITTNAAAFLARLNMLYGDTPVYVVLPIWRDDLFEEPVGLGGDFMEVRASIRRLAESQGFHVVDNYELLPHDVRLYSDGLHPNDAGFQIYAQGLIQAIGE